jgi:hypothetical protein
MITSRRRKLGSAQTDQKTFGAFGPKPTFDHFHKISLERTFNEIGIEWHLDGS